MGGRGSEDQPKAHGRAVTASAAGSVLRFRILLPFSTSLGRVSQHGVHQATIPGARRRSDIRVLRLLIPGVGPVGLPGISQLGRGGRRRRVTRGGTGSDSGEAAMALRFALRRLEGRGRPLDAAVRRRLEPVLPFSTARVRIHTGVAAAESARRLRARAFTIGADVYFGAGQFRPQSVTGLALLSHELTHVRQQGARERVRRYTRDGGDRWEREAQEVEARFRTQLTARQPEPRPVPEVRFEFASQPVRAKSIPEVSAYRALAAAPPATPPGCEKTIDYTQDVAPVAEGVYRLLKQEARLARERGPLRFRG